MKPSDRARRIQKKSAAKRARKHRTKRANLIFNLRSKVLRSLGVREVRNAVEQAAPVEAPVEVPKTEEVSNG